MTEDEVIATAVDALSPWISDGRPLKIEVAASTRIFSDAPWSVDDLDLIEMLNALEDAFLIPIQDDEISDEFTFGDLVVLVQRKTDTGTGDD